MSVMQFVNLVDFSRMPAVIQPAGPACAGPSWAFLQGGLPTLDGLVKAGPSDSWVVLMDRSFHDALTPSGREFVAQHELGHVWLSHDFAPAAREQFVQRELDADAYALRRVSISPAELAGTWAVALAAPLRGLTVSADFIRQDVVGGWQMAPRLRAMGVDAQLVLHLTLKLLGL